MSASPNTALLGLPPLRPSPHKQPSFSRSPSSSAVPKASTATKRARSSSIVSVQEVADTYDDQLDQAALNNINADWVNYKGPFRPTSLLLPALGHARGGLRYRLCTCLSRCSARKLSLVPSCAARTDPLLLLLLPGPRSSLAPPPSLARAGAWLIHVVLIASAILLLETIPGMSQDLTWTIVNLGYLSVRRLSLPLFSLHEQLADPESALQVSYVIFHYVTGVPFDMTNNSGAFDNLTLWEQIDSGAQYTPAKKWLTSVPIFLCVPLDPFLDARGPSPDLLPLVSHSFLLSTHYTRYDSHPALFTLNLVALLFLGLAPKLPAFHRLRIKFFDAGEGATPGASALLLLPALRARLYDASSMALTEPALTPFVSRLQIPRHRRRPRTKSSAAEPLVRLVRASWASQSHQFLLLLPIFMYSYTASVTGARSIPPPRCYHSSFPSLSPPSSSLALSSRPLARPLFVQSRLSPRRYTCSLPRRIPTPRNNLAVGFFRRSGSSSREGRARESKDASCERHDERLGTQRQQEERAMHRCRSAEASPVDLLVARSGLARRSRRQAHDGDHARARVRALAWEERLGELGEERCLLRRREDCEEGGRVRRGSLVRSGSSERRTRRNSATHRR